MFRNSVLVLLMMAAAVLSACENTAETYPVSGEQCGPEDPVQTLDAADCNVPPAGV